MEWQPIETVPDLEPVLLWCEKYRDPFIGYKNARGSFINDQNDDIGRVHRLTHWMKLPSAPNNIG